MKSQLGLIFAFLLASAGPVLSLVSLERILSVESFGAFATFVALVAFTSTLWLWGVDGLVVRELLRGSGRRSMDRWRAYEALMAVALGASILALLSSLIFDMNDIWTRNACIFISGISLALINARVAILRAKGLVVGSLVHAFVAGAILPGLIIFFSFFDLPMASILGHSIGYGMYACTILLRDLLGRFSRNRASFKPLRKSIVAIFKMGSRTVPHTLALMGLLTFDRLVLSQVGSLEMVGQVALGGLVGSVGHAGVAALTTSRLSYAYRARVPEMRMAETVLICLAAVLIGLAVAPVLASWLSWSSGVARLGQLYALSPLCSVVYASFSSIIFVERKELMLTIATPTIFLVSVAGYVFAGVTGAIVFIPLVQAGGYSLLSLATVVMLIRWKRDSRPLLLATGSWIVSLMVAFCLIVVSA